MVKVLPLDTRSKISDTNDGLIITIPSKSQWFATIFMIFWMGSWAVGGTTAIQSLFVDGQIQPFLLFWLGAWTVGGAAVFVGVAWAIAGSEIIRVSAATLAVSHQVLGIGITKDYDISHIERVRVSPSEQADTEPRGLVGMLGQGAGKIAFDYGAATVRFGADIDEAEARLILDRIACRLPRMDQRRAPMHAAFDS